VSIQEEYDAIVIGSGEAGKYMAWHLASKGQRVASVEDKQVGEHVRTWLAYPARTSSIPPRLLRTFVAGLNLVSGTGMGRSICPL